MKIRVLLDNTAKEGFESAHGFSLAVEADENILFDLGPNNLFLENAKKLDVDLDLFETIVLSHGHWDHGDGLQFISGKNLITHPGAFTLRFREESCTPVGLSMSKEAIASNFKLKESKQAFWISKQMVFLGEIPRRNEFESKETTFLLEDGSPDFVLDDSAIAVTSRKGLVVISGCAHAGICNTISYAKEVCNTNEVYAVLGGFHLKKKDELFQQTLKFLMNENVELLGATHCTSFKIQDEFAKHFTTINLEAGLEFEL